MYLLGKRTCYHVTVCACFSLFSLFSLSTWKDSPKWIVYQNRDYTYQHKLDMGRHHFEMTWEDDGRRGDVERSGVNGNFRILN